jgi:signal transduction histidine kinase
MAGATRPVAGPPSLAVWPRWRGWWRRRGLQARLTMLASLVVAAGLVAGSLLLLASLQRSLVDALDTTARQRAQDVAALADSGRLPDPIPVAGAGTVQVQVVDSRGRVRAASVGSDRAVPLLGPAELETARDRRPRFLDGSRLGERDPLRVIAWPAGTASDPLTVIAAASSTSVAGSLRIVEVGLLLGGPLLLALFAGMAWIAVGRALRPVAGLRRGAEEITGTGQSRRLPLPDAQDEIHRLGVTLNRMLDRLEEAGRRQRGFVADAAHELRSPLTSMRVQLEVASEHPELADWQRLSKGVLADTLRLGRMVEDLLALARLDESPGAVQSRELELGDVAREVAGRLPAAGAQVTVDLDGGARVRGDRQALGRAVQNLLDNAVRHATSRVEVSVGSDGGLAVLAVTDDGPGIPAGDRERVFERFTRLDDSRSREHGGAGLGLAIAREIVRAHGGELTAEDGTPGARLVMRLPAEAPAGASSDAGRR